ncbi:MAG TPA: hypothetical protein VGV13_16525 [Methylomirabilota bacterium]|nr:hypothetical protein [Methylomirabilota bacterium]
MTGSYAGRGSERDLDEVRVEGVAAAQVRYPVAGQHVDGAVARVNAVPPDAFDHDHARSRGIADASREARRSSIVEDTHRVPIPDPAPGRVGGGVNTVGVFCRLRSSG